MAADASELSLQGHANGYNYYRYDTMDAHADVDTDGYFSNADSKLTLNMRSQNNELVTSGIYIYCVESNGNTQIGKIVIVL